MRAVRELGLEPYCGERYLYVMISDDYAKAIEVAAAVSGFH